MRKQLCSDATPALREFSRTSPVATCSNLHACFFTAGSWARGPHETAVHGLNLE